MRDMYVSVVGDRAGAAFLGYVAPDGTPFAISDVDGTLTATENAFLTSIATGASVGMQPDAAGAYTELAQKHIQPVYITARGNQYTQATRDWLDAAGVPRRPLPLAASFLTLPGADTVALKTGAPARLADLSLAVGVGNRDT